MRKPDEPVREVTCHETGKPMTKIPLWMADVKVKFISDEARQKHPALPGLSDIEPLRRNVPDIDGLKDLDAAGAEPNRSELHFQRKLELARIIPRCCC